MVCRGGAGSVSVAGIAVGVAAGVATATEAGASPDVATRASIVNGEAEAEAERANCYGHSV